jgi:hypothetical protein
VHNRGVIGFHRRTALQLADTVPVIRCLIAQVQQTHSTICYVMRDT